MRERDKIGGSSLFVRGRRHLVGIGCSAAVVVISLAGAYAVYGDSSDRKLDTSGTRSQQLRVEDSDTLSVPQTQGQESTVQQNQNTEQSGDASNQSQSTTTVTINGQQVAVPANGEVHQTINGANSQTNISVQSNHSSTSSGNSASNTNNSSVNMNVTSESH